MLSTTMKEALNRQVLMEAQSSQAYLAMGSWAEIQPGLKGVTQFFFKHSDDNYFKLYTFLGYGYGLIYTDKSELAIPQTSPGGSPIVNWIKIDEHWYYYSYFD